MNYLKKLYRKLVKNEDDKILYKNVVGTIGIKGLSIIVSFLTTSMYIAYFGESVTLGVWFTLLSILQWILTFDFGIGNGLRNKLVPCIEKNDSKAIKEYVSSGYISLSILCFIIAIISGIIIPNLDWNSILNISDSVIQDDILKITIVVTVIGLLLQFLFKTITSILYALRKNILANITTLVSSILLCCFLGFGKYLPFDSKTKLICLAFAYTITTLAPLLIVTFIVFSKLLKGYYPSLRYFKLDKAREVISLGGVFFIIQLELLVLTSTDSWFIMYLFSPEDVVSYQIYYKLFSLPTTMFALLSQPLWSSISFAFARGDVQWIKKQEVKAYYVAILASVICIVEVLLSSFIIRVWVGASACEINTSIAFWFGILSVGQLFMYASTSVANGISKLGCQAICNLIAVILKFTLTFTLAKMMNHWVCVVIVETIGTFIIAIAQPIMNRINLVRR